MKRQSNRIRNKLGFEQFEPREMKTSFWPELDPTLAPAFEDPMDQVLMSLIDDDDSLPAGDADDSVGGSDGDDSPPGGNG